MTTRSMIAALFLSVVTAFPSFVMPSPSFGSVLMSANATNGILGGLDVQRSTVPGSTVTASVSDPQTDARGQAVYDYTLRVFAQSDSAGGAVGVAPAASVSSGFTILGNPNNVLLPIIFNFSLNGTLSVDPDDLALGWAGGAFVAGSVSVNGAVGWSGSMQIDSNFVHGNQLNFFGDMQASDVISRVDIGDATTVTVGTNFGVSSLLVNSGILGAGTNASAVGGSLVSTADFYSPGNSLRLTSISLANGFSDPNVNVNNLRVQFDSGLVMPVSTPVVPEPSSLICWSVLAIGGMYRWLRNSKVSRRQASNANSRNLVSKTFS